MSLLTTAGAAVVGATAAYLGGAAEKVILEVIHFLLVVPTFLILALVSQRARGDWLALIIVLTLFGWMFGSSAPNQAYVNVVNRCLAEKGYEVSGWQ